MSMSTNSMPLWLLCALGNCYGEITVSTQGFISQGFVASHNTTLFDKDSDFSTDLTEAAVRIALQTDQRLRFSMQTLYRRAGSHQEEGLRIDHLLLDYNLPTESSNYSAGVQLGRIKPKIGLYNESRDIAWTRPGIFLSQSIYPEILRDAYLTADGIYLYQRWYFSDSNLSLNLGYGHPDTGDKVAENYWGESAQGDMSTDPATNIALTYQLRNNWLFGWSWVEASFDFDADRDASITSGTLDISMNIFSLQYQGEEWELTAELALNDIEDEGHFPVELGNNPYAQPFLPDSKENESLRYSLQARYRLSSHWTLTGRYEVQYFDKNDKSGEDYAEISRQAAELAELVNPPGTNTLTAQPNYSAYGKAWTAGIEWQPNKQWLVRAEATAGEGLAWVPTLLEFCEDTVNEKYWSIFAVQASYRF